MIIVFSLAGCKDARDVGHLIEVNPQAAHGVVHAREDLHRYFARIVADKLFVNFEDALKLTVQCFLIYMGQVEVDHWLPIDAQAVLVHHLMDRTRSDITRHQVAVLGIPLFEEVPAIGRGNAVGWTRIVQLLRHPHPATLAACGFRHQAQLVFAGD